MNKNESTVNTEAVILTLVARRKTKFRELLEWIRDEKKIPWNQLASRSGLFGRTAITQQIKKPDPNPGFEMINGIAKVAKIPEQMIIDACLGREFLSSREIENKSLKEILRKYQLIEPENRTESLNRAISLLADMVDEALDKQSE